MITTRIIGGLGNQLFQYALARNLALKNNTDLQLDTLEFATYPHHKYSLQHFNIIEQEATEEELRHFHNIKAYIASEKFSYKIIKKLKLEKYVLFSRGYIKEFQSTYDPKILDITGDVYLDGYWQSEKYFKNIRETLLKDLTLKKPMSDQGKKFQDEIHSKEMPVSLHIRRGDFANNPVQSKFHGVTPLEHHYAGIKIITEKHPNPHFFVFSDSIEWARENFKTSYPTTFIDLGVEKNYEELMLMSFCKHHILSNSTFGWWGAWLAQSKDQIVVAPKKWFNKSIDLSDLMPEDWIKI